MREINETGSLSDIKKLVRLMIIAMIVIVILVILYYTSSTTTTTRSNPEKIVSRWG